MNNDQFNYLIGLTVACTLTIITAILVVGAMVTTEFVATWLLLIGALLMGTVGYAVLTDGYCRRFWDRLVGFDKPPLDERDIFTGDRL